ncbi:MAG TPA: prepilin-type N-terminal cleavage/methylation domain-containing protein [Gemmatimonadales bacterium]|nr:prepilin-type N-terminal cleavage/methylation domain-containing protein [Gemmatimonadales bacterium]
MTGRHEKGFTLVELLVYVVIAGFIMTSAYRLMITQGRAFGKQREVLDVRETNRSASASLAWDLRHAAMGRSQVAVMNAGKLTLRSIQGYGVVCAKHPLLPRIALWKTGGTIAATVDDTALIYGIGRDQWRRVKITQVGTPGAMGIPACALPGAPAPDVVVQIAVVSKMDTAAILVGAPFRNFRRIEYTEFSTAGRWWLGRRVGSAVGYEQLTGPLLPPPLGLAFTYHDTLGAVTANPAALSSVGITLRAQSFKRARLAGAPAFVGDSLTTRVALRP